MVARGDLAVEISLSKVPLLQKALLKEANIRGKFTIVATEMLSSMVDNPRPTRAEASDIANAILDGTDAVMLSNETAIGKFPVQSVKVMKDIIIETEESMLNENFHISLDMPNVHTMTQAICESASHLSYFLNERALAVISHSGSSVHVLSKYRPQSQIIAATYDPVIFRRMALFHNVKPVLLKDNKDKKDPESSLKLFEQTLKDSKTVQTKDILIFLTGDIAPSGWKVNTIKIHIIE
jgi:pyruvate kinase